MRRHVPDCLPIIVALNVTLSLTGALGCGKPVEQFFVGPRPELPEPVKAIRIGMTKDEAMKAVPGLSQYGTMKSGYRNVDLTVEFDIDGKEVERVSVSPKGMDPEALMTAAWGAPMPGTVADKPTQFWFNPQAGLRVHINRVYSPRVVYETYTPYETIFGATGKAFAFEEKQPLIGATKAQVNAAYRVDQDVYLRLPRVKCALTFTTSQLKYGKDGKVSGYSIALDEEECKPTADELTPLFTAKFGPPKKNKINGQETLIFQEKPVVIALSLEKDVKDRFNPLGGLKNRWTLAVLDPSR
jgi:hypothetical protein